MQRYPGSIAPCDHNAQTSQTDGQTDITSRAKKINTKQQHKIYQVDQANHGSKIRDKTGLLILLTVTELLFKQDRDKLPVGC